MSLPAAPNRKPTKLRIAIHASIGRAYVPYLSRKLRAAAKLVPTALNELSVALVNDKVMSELHEQFMNIPGPTDVLTFPIETDGKGRATSGEVVICVPEARRRAREMRTDVGQELLLYALHGMLHLSGFDDRTKQQYHRMHHMEDRILRQLGVGPVFVPKGRP